MNIQTNLSILGSVEMLFNHYRWWVDGESNTILVDPSMNIIAFFNRWESNTDIIQADELYQWEYIYECRWGYHENVSFIKHKARIKYNDFATINKLDFILKINKILTNVKENNKREN